MTSANQNTPSASSKSGAYTYLTYRVPRLHIRIPIDPSEASSQDDQFTLTSSDGKYKKTLTVKDDKIDGDKFVDLVFENLKISGKYTLEINPGAEGSPYKVFEEIPYNELIDYYSELEPGDTLEAKEEEEAANDKSENAGDSEDSAAGGSESLDVDDEDRRMTDILEKESADIEDEEDEEIDWETSNGNPEDMSEAEDEDSEDTTW